MWNDGMKNIIQSSKIHESVTDQARRGVTPCLLKTIQEMVAEARLIFSWNKNGSVSFLYSEQYMIITIILWVIYLFQFGYSEGYYSTFHTFVIVFLLEVRYYHIIKSGSLGLLKCSLES